MPMFAPPQLRLCALSASIASLLYALPASADIDRLQLINGTLPSVDPGELLNDGVFFDGELIFAGKNLTTNAEAELHSALITDAATVPRLDGITESAVTGVTRIDELSGSLFISNAAGVDVLNVGEDTTVPVSTAPSSSVEAVQQAGALYLIGDVDADSRVDLSVLDTSVSSDFQLISSGVRTCQDSAMAAAGQSTVIFIDGTGSLRRVIAPSTSDELVFSGGATQTFTVPCNLIGFGGRVFFDAFEGGSDSNQIYVTDGTISGTDRLRGFNIEGNGTFQPSFRELGGRLLFAASAEQNGVYDIWSTDGSEDGTTLFKELGAAQGAIELINGTVYKGQLFFTVADALWRTDGSSDGTVQVMVGDAPVEMDSEPSLSEFDEELYFVATVSGSKGIFRLSEPGDEPRMVSGITQTPTAINGLLAEKLLVAADNNLFTMDKEPVISIAADTEVAENEGTQQVTVQITVSPVVPYEVSFDVATVDGTAIAGNDYVQVPTTRLTIPANTPQTTQTIALQNDSTQEPTEQFTLLVNNPDGARFADRAAQSISGTVTITDSDEPVQAGSLQVQPAVVAEDGVNAVITVITGGNSEVDIDFDFSTADGTAIAGADYTASNGSGTIPAGSSSTTIVIPVLDDATDEPNETFTVTVTPTSGLTSGLGTALAPVTVTIIDNDDAPIPEEDEEPVESGGSSGGGGGCSINTGSGNDPLLAVLMLGAAGALFVRRRRTSAST